MLFLILRSPKHIRKRSENLSIKKDSSKNGSKLDFVFIFAGPAFMVLELVVLIVLMAFMYLQKSTFSKDSIIGYFERFSPVKLLQLLVTNPLVISLLVFIIMVLWYIAFRSYKVMSIRFKTQRFIPNRKNIKSEIFHIFIKFLGKSLTVGYLLWLMIVVMSVPANIAANLTALLATIMATFAYFGYFKN